MSEPRKKADWPIVAAVVAVVLLLATGGTYVGGYFATSQAEREADFRTCRTFNARWQYDVYAPIIEIERIIRGGKFYPAFISTTPPDESIPELRPRDLP